MTESYLVGLPNFFRITWFLKTRYNNGQISLVWKIFEFCCETRSRSRLKFINWLYEVTLRSPCNLVSQKFEKTSTDPSSSSKILPFARCAVKSEKFGKILGSLFYRSFKKLNYAQNGMIYTEKFRPKISVSVLSWNLAVKASIFCAFLELWRRRISSCLGFLCKIKLSWTRIYHS